MKCTPFLILFLLFAINLKAQCPTGAQQFNSQQEVDDFMINYPNCTEIDNNVAIIGEDITNLDGLANIEYIDYLLISGAASLTNMYGSFPNLTTVNSIGVYSSNLESFDGLDQITNVDLIFFVENNELNFINLPGISGPVVEISIISNPILNSINLLGIEAVTDKITINVNMMLTHLDMGALTSVTNTFILSQTSLFAMNLQSLTTVGGNLNIANNILSSVIGLASLQTVGGTLQFGNTQISSLEELTNLQSIGSLSLTSNYELSYCSITAICNHLVNNGVASISNNLGGCGSVSEVLSFCEELDCSKVDYQIGSITPTACPFDTLQPDVCLNVCPYSSHVYIVPEIEREITWNVIGAESFEVVGNQLVVDWGEPGSGLVEAEVEEIGCNMSVQLGHIGNFAYFADVENGEPPLTYLWTLPDGSTFTEGSFQWPIDGEWTLEVTDAFECTATETFIFPQQYDCNNYNVVLLADISPATNCQESDGAIEMQVFGGTDPYTFVWSNGSGIPSSNNLSPGFYNVTVTDVNGCQSTAQYEVSCDCGSLSYEFENGSCSGSIVINSPPNELIIESGVKGRDGYDESGLVHTNLFPGMYEVFLKTSTCEYRETIEIENLSDIEYTSNLSNPTVCGECDGYIGIHNLIGDYDISWSNGSTNQSQQGLCAGEYTVFIANLITGVVCDKTFVLTCNDTEEECPFDISLCVDILEEVEAIITTTPPTENGAINICAGQTIYFESESNNAETYVWDFGNGETDIGGSTEFTYDIAGSYIVQLIARNECLCSDTTSVNVNVEQAIIPKLDCVGTVCENSEVTYTTDADCTSYTWEITGDGIVTNGGTNTDDFITIDWGAGPLGTINLSVDNCTEDYCVLENITQIPIIGNNDNIKGRTEVCKGDLDVYSITNYGGTNFLWEVSTFGEIVSGQGTNTVSIQWTDIFIPNSAQWVRVTYENCYLECGGMDELEVNILDEYFFSGPIELCAGATGTYIAEALSGTSASVNWTLRDVQNSVIMTGGPSSTFDFDLTGNPIGLYTLEASPADAANFCSDSYLSFINLLAGPPSPTGIEGTTEICVGEIYTYEAISGQTDYSFLWIINDGGNITNKQGKYANIAWNSSGPYSLEVAQVENSEAACESYPISISLNAISDITISGPASHCIESSSIFTATNYPQINYTWTVTPSNAATIVEGQSTNTIELFWHTAGNATVSLEACGINAVNQIQINPRPIPVVNHPIELCEGQTELVTVSEVFSNYEWKSETGAVFSNDATVLIPPGYYELTVIDANGCEGNTIFNIEPLPLPEVVISSPNLLIYCSLFMPTPTLIAMESNPPFEYQWYYNNDAIPGETSAFYTPPTDESGQYKVEVTDINGCKNFSNTLTVSAGCGDDGPPPELQCIGADVSFDIASTAKCNFHKFDNTTPTQIPGTTEWFFGFPDVEGTAIGDNVSYEYQMAGYYVVVMLNEMNNNGVIEVCGIAQVDLVPVAPDFNANPACIGSDMIFEDLSTYIPGDGVTSWTWDFGDPASGPDNISNIQHPIHDYAVAGTYDVTLTITGENGCEATLTKQVDVQDYPSPTFSLPTEDCQDVPLDFTAIVADDIVNVYWDFGDPASGDANTSEVMETYHAFESPGSYTITLTAETIYGCQESYTETIEVQPNPLSGEISIVPGSTICEGQFASLIAPPGGLYFEWSNGASGNPTVVTEAGAYSVTITDTHGCTYTPPDAVLDILPVPEGEIRVVEYDEFGQPIQFFYDNYVICEGEEVFMEINQVDGYIYEWNSGQSGTNIEFSVDRNNLLEEGVYEFDVTITDSNTGCTNIEGPFTVTVNAIPEDIILTSDPAGFVCDNNPVTISISNYDPNITYVWNTGTIGATSLIVEVPGIYTVRGINANGCETTSNEIEVHKGPDINRIPAGCHKQCLPDTLCLPNMPTIISWQWYFNDELIPAPEGTTEEFIATESGDYYVEMIDTFGCVATSGIMSLDLFLGLGTINGEVYFDVNDNGIIDGPDTLLSDQTIFIEGDNYTSLTISNVDGSYTFNDFPSIDYDLYFDSLSLPAGWSVLESFQEMELIGCDDVEVVNWLVVNTCMTESGSETFEACTGSTIDYNGLMLSPNDTVDVVLENALGCDSIVTVIVSELLPTFENLDIEECDGESVTVNGVEIQAGEFYQFDFTNSVGCDSTLIVAVVPIPLSFEAIELYACEGDSILYHGEYLLPNTTQDVILESFFGCDSIEEVTVLPLGSEPIELNEMVCQDEAFVYNDQEYEAGASAIFTYQSVQGCDSIVQLNVSQTPAFSFQSETEIICYDDLGYLEIINLEGASAPYSFSLDGENFQGSTTFIGLEPGDYTIYTQDAFGCINSIPGNIPVYDRLNVEVEDATLTCEFNTVELNAELITGPEEALEFIWPDGTNGSVSSIQAAGNYFLQASNICEEQSVSFTVFPAVTELENYLYVPNVFSPNGDGNNDFFIVSPASDVIIHSYEIHVFNRWGEEQYASTDITDGWDGKLKNGYFNPGVHVWWIKIDATFCGNRSEIFTKGDITVIR